MITLFLEAEVDEWQVQGAPNKETMAQGLLTNLRADGSEESRTGALELARLVLKAGNPSRLGIDAPRWWTGLRVAVAADGWEFDEAKDRLVPTVPAVCVAEEVTWIEEELASRGWTTAAGHYNQAIESFASGNWAAANSQLRTFFEDLILTATGDSSSHARGAVYKSVDRLDQAGRLIRHESAFIKKLWKILQPRGSHPGLSDEHESRFRLLVLTGYARFLLRRLP